MSSFKFNPFTINLDLIRTFWERDATNGYIYPNTLTDKVGIGIIIPTEKLDVVGDFILKDAATPTKSYRYRTSGEALDFEAGGAALFVSVWSGADYTGTQRNYLTLNSTEHVLDAFGKWYWRKPDFGIRHQIDSNAAGDVIFNENGEATDFRVESDTNENMLIVDGTNNRVGIGTLPNSTQHVNGSISKAYVAKTTNYTLTEIDYQVECTANTFTITLPTAVGITGREYSIKNSGVGTITVDGDGTETIDDDLTTEIPQYENLKIMSNGANWIVT